MKRHSFKQGAHTGKPAIAVVIGLTVSFILSLLLSAVAAWAVSDGKLQENAIGAAVWPIQFIATAIGCLIATLLMGSMPAIISAVCGGAYLLLLIAINILFFDGSMGGIGSGVLSVLCGTLVPIILQLLGKKGRRPIKRR